MGSSSQNFGGENKKYLSCHHLEDVFSETPNSPTFLKFRKKKKKRERHRNVTWLEAKVHDQLMPFHARLGEPGLQWVRLRSFDGR